MADTPRETVNYNRTSCEQSACKQPATILSFVLVPFADVYSHQHSLALEPVHLSSLGGNYLKLEGVVSE